MSSFVGVLRCTWLCLFACSDAGNRSCADVTDTGGRRRMRGIDREMLQSVLQCGGEKAVVSRARPSPAVRRPARPGPPHSVDKPVARDGDRVLVRAVHQPVEAGEIAHSFFREDKAFYRLCRRCGTAGPRSGPRRTGAPPSSSSSPARCPPPPGRPGPPPSAPPGPRPQRRGGRPSARTPARRGHRARRRPASRQSYGRHAPGIPRPCWSTSPAPAARGHASARARAASARGTSGRGPTRASSPQRVSALAMSAMPPPPAADPTPVGSIPNGHVDFIGASV
jgi:hypothetical protein